MIIRAKQRGEAIRIVTLAHQTEAMARQKKLRPLADYLKPLTRHRPRRLDDFETLGRALERRIKRQSKQKDRRDGSD